MPQPAACAKDHQCAVARLVADFHFLAGKLLFDIYAERGRGIAKAGTALKDIGKSLPACIKGNRREVLAGKAISR